jgi:hypothetical protein
MERLEKIRAELLGKHRPASNNHYAENECRQQTRSPRDKEIVFHQKSSRILERFEKRSGAAWYRQRRIKV